MPKLASTIMHRVLQVGLLMLALAPAAQAQGWSLRFFGNGVNDIDRVKIRIDGPEVPADVGAGDFTLELWVRANPGENSSSGCGTGLDDWIYGNILLDRDIWGGGDYGDFGLAVFQEGLSFGVRNASGYGSLCGATPIDDGAWHHVAITRAAATGILTLFVDGQIDAASVGPTGDLSYRNGRPGMPNDPFLVIGAEKHDAGSEYPSFRGWVDELRLSTVVRYAEPFVRPLSPFDPDGATAALYHFDEGSGFTAQDGSGAAGGPSNGVLSYGGSPAGPVWSGETPFGGSGGTCPPDGCGTIPPGAPVRWSLAAQPNPSWARTDFTLRAFSLENGLQFAISPDAWGDALGRDSFTPILRILDVQGRQVGALRPLDGDAGVRFRWDGADEAGRPLPAGVYWAALPGVPSARVRVLRLR